MFPDARVAPVHKDGSFTLVSSGLKDHLEDKLYNSTAFGLAPAICGAIYLQLPPIYKPTND